MNTINLLHISDLHISAIPNRKEVLNFKDFLDKYKRFMDGSMAASQNSRIVEALASFVLERTQFIDGIMITGDIATEGISSDLNEALKLVTAKPVTDSFRTKTGSPTLNVSENLPIFLLPGNHDRYIPDCGLWSPGGKVFQQVFSDFWKDDVMSYEIIKDDSFLGIVAADFSLQSEEDSTKDPQYFARLAQGCVYDEILEKMVIATKKLQEKARDNHMKVVITWAMHFPPEFDYGSKFRDLIVKKAHFHQLINEELLLSSAISNKVQLIMAGHTHVKDFYFDKTKKIRIACAGSATQFYPENDESSNQCQIIRIEYGVNEPLLSITNFEFNRYFGEFIPM